MDTADEILSQIPLDQLAQQLGVDEATAEQAVRQAVPALLGGMEANARDPGGAASLEKALGQHAGSPLEGLDLGSIDTADGEAIVGNVFGDNSEQVINKLGEQGPAAPESWQKLLPILAPIVLNLLAGKFLGQGQARPGRTRDRRPRVDRRVASKTSSAVPRAAADPAGSVTCSAGCSVAAVGLGGSSDVIGDLLGGLLGGGSKRLNAPADQAGNSSNSVRILAMRPVQVSRSAGGTSSTSRAAASRMAIPAGEPVPVVTTGVP